MRRNRLVFIGLIVGVVTGQLLSLSLVYAVQEHIVFDGIVWTKGLAIETEDGGLAIVLLARDDGSGLISFPQGGRILLTSPNSEQRMFIDVNDEETLVWSDSAMKGWVGMGVDTDFTGVQVNQGDGIIHQFPGPSDPERPSTAAKPTTWGDIKAMQAEVDQIFKR